ncbi:MAG: hypothetical protein QW829_04550 [Candidatus Bathyarchaeia archaeon]
MGRSYCRGIRLRRAGVNPSAHIPVIIFLSENMGLLHVDIEVTK